MNVMHKRFVYLNMKQNNICSNIYTNNKDFLRKQTFVSKMNDAGKSMTSANRGTTGTVSNLGQEEYIDEEEDLRNLIESKQFDENQWFWIESEKQKEQEQAYADQSMMSNSTSKMTMVNQFESSIFQNFTYQEVLFFMKLANTFEDQKYLSSMILQLIMNFPLVWKRLDVPHDLLVKDKIAKSNSRSSQESTFAILDYLFPLDKLKYTLDNMCRQQIINLHQILSSANERLSSQSNQLSTKSGRPFRKTHIFQLINQEYDIKMPSDYCVNELLTLDSADSNQQIIEVPYLKDLLKLFITKLKLKIDEEISYEDKYIEQKNKLKDKVYKVKETVRDQMKKEYFVTIDERVFMECNIQRNQFENENVKDISLYKFVKVLNPVTLSVQLLAKVSKFWTETYNKDLTKKRPDNIKKDRDKRVHYLTTKVQSFIDYFQIYQPDFEAAYDPEDSEGMTKEVFAEKQKQCFYINIYNSLIIYKLSEIATFKSSQIWSFKNHSSWVALEQNTSINICGKKCSAFYIKHEVIKNARNKKPSMLVCDSQHLHPFIDLAFFMPKGGSLLLESLCFHDIEYLEKDFTRIVKNKLIERIRINKNFNLIMLPEILKPCIATSNKKNHKDSIIDSEYISEAMKDPKQHQVLKLEQVLNILQFIQNGFQTRPENYCSIEQHMDKIINQIQEQIRIVKQNSDNADTQDYIIEYQAHGQEIKLNKIICALKQKFSSNESYAKECKKKLQLDKN